MPEEAAPSVTPQVAPATAVGPGEAVEAALVRPEAAYDPKSAAEALIHGESPLSGLPMQLDVIIPIPGFRVADLLALERGSVLETHWQHTDDVPVWSGGAQLVWTEFEVLGQRLAVRVTRLG